DLRVALHQLVRIGVTIEAGQVPIVGDQIILEGRIVLRRRRRGRASIRQDGQTSQRCRDDRPHPYSPALVCSTGRPGAGKVRSCFKAGILRRASATASRSMVALTTPTSSPPSTMTSPQGSTINEWPQVLRPSAWVPHWLGASTKLPVSIARARARMCQCALPVA